MFSFSGCEREEAEEKPMTAYLDWYGVTIDLSEVDIVKSPTYDAFVYWDEISFENTLESYGEKYDSFVVVRAKCTGNLVQKSYSRNESKHYLYHNPNEKANSTRAREYISIPFEILEVLDGDSTIVEGISNVDLEIQQFIFNPSMIESPSFRRNISIDYFPYAVTLIIPRVGFEYIVAFTYHEETNCYEMISDGAECEISTSREFFEYQVNLNDSGPIIGEPNLDSGQYRYYREILEHYNIIVE